MERVRGWINARPITWALGLLVAGLVIGGATGAASTSDLEDEKRDLESELAAAKTEAVDARGRASHIEGMRNKIIAEAKTKAASIVGSSRGEASEAKQALSSLRREVSVTEDELSEINSSLEGAEEEKSMSTFGEGVMKADVDYTLEATYEASGGHGCYWALLNSANTSDTASNEFTTNATQQIVTIETPYFTSEDCGTWHRIE